MTPNLALYSPSYENRFLGVRNSLEQNNCWLTPNIQFIS